MSTDTQCAAILKYMRTKGAINPMIALREMRCARLAARILDLRKDGHLISSALVTRRGKRYSAYSLIG